MVLWRLRHEYVIKSAVSCEVKLLIHALSSKPKLTLGHVWVITSRLHKYRSTCQISCPNSTNCHLRFLIAMVMVTPVILRWYISAVLYCGPWTIKPIDDINYTHRELNGRIIWQHGRFDGNWHMSQVYIQKKLTMVNIMTYHYSDVIINAMTSQISSVSVVYLTVCSGQDQRKHQSSGDRWILRTKGQ